jgi:uncharacterized cupredoxin-like copper-binding protein
MNAPTMIRGDKRRLAIGAAVILVIAAVIGVGVSTRSSSVKTVATVHVTERDYRVDLDTTHVPAGKVRLSVQNAGLVEHELVVFRTDMRESAMPMGDGLKVDEEARGITHLDPEAENIRHGQTKTIVVDLTPGRYVLICNLPGHYAQGMHHMLTVG